MTLNLSMILDKEEYENLLEINETKIKSMRM